MGQISTDEGGANESDVEKFVTVFGQALDPRKFGKSGNARENGISGDYGVSLSVQEGMHIAIEPPSPSPG